MYPKDAFVGCLSCKVDSGQNKNSLHEVDTSHSSAVRRYRRTRGAQSTFSSWISQVWTRCEAEANYFSQDKEGTLNWIMLLKGVICFLTGSASPWGGSRIKLNARRLEENKQTNIKLSSESCNGTFYTDRSYDKVFRSKSKQCSGSTSHTSVSLIWRLGRCYRFTGEKKWGSFLRVLDIFNLRKPAEISQSKCSCVLWENHSESFSCTYHCTVTI